MPITRFLAAIAFTLFSRCPAAAQFRPFNAAAPEESPINFCAQGKFFIFSGSCSPSGRYKDVISQKACADAAQVLHDGLSYLYPNASVESLRDLTPDEITEALMRPLVKGFFLVGEGDTKGGFVTGPEHARFYPDISVCRNADLDLFGAVTAHSKYSPEVPARKSDTGRVISRHELIYGGKGAPEGSWAALCKPRMALVYPTRTFAGRVKDDLKKFLYALMEEKKKHVLKTLNTICDNCPGHVASGGPLAQLCPPNSNVCKLRKITPGSEEFILENYCSALAPTPVRQ